jgi:NAD(P)-dependent dehydrogenase (short-subunit alcohol dehydrogenase family)
MHDRVRCAVITGGGGAGCGRAISMKFAAHGMRVVVSDLDVTRGTETVRLIQEQGGAASFFAADVRDDNQAKNLIGFAESEFDGVDVLVNNASAPHGKLDLDSWMDAVRTDFLGAMYATHWTINSLRRRQAGGAIVNISSISALWHGRTTPGGLPGYDVAKAAMITMTTRLAPLAKTDQIRVNCLAPGWIATDEVKPIWEQMSPAERTARGAPTRLLSTEDVASAVLWLAENSSLAGRVLVWWSEDKARLIQWGDRGYREYVEITGFEHA